MVFLRIKQAEQALAEGRLEDVHQMLQETNIRDHHRGQKLVNSLINKLVSRGRDHLENNRLSAALTDCTKADKLGGDIIEVAALKHDICKALDQNRNAGKNEALRHAQAKECFENGWLTVGRQILDEADPENIEAELLNRQAQMQKMQIEDAVGKISQALTDGKLEIAISIFERLRIKKFQNRQLAELADEITAKGLEIIRDSLQTGRIDLASALTDKLRQVADGSLEYEEMLRAVSQCRRAWKYISQNRLQAALRVLHQLKRVIGKAQWLEEALACTQQALGAFDDLSNGPLGLLAHSEYVEPDSSVGLEADEITVDNNPPVENKAVESPPARSGGVLPEKFVIQVDGVGSYLVLRSGIVKLGPVSSSENPDIALMAQSGLPTATIERAEGDYFVKSSMPIDVNGRQIKEKLLISGDKIAISPRLPVKFNLPNAASGTAVLDLTNVRLARVDIRYALLMKRELVIGSGSSAHVRCENATERIVLAVNNGRLISRKTAGVLAGGNQLDNEAPLPMNESIEIGGVRMVLKEA